MGHLISPVLIERTDHPFISQDIQKIIFYVRTVRKLENVIYVSCLLLHLYKCYFGKRLRLFCVRQKDFEGHMQQTPADMKE